MSARLAGALTFDVEDYYHVSAFERVIDRAQWPHLASRVEDSTARLLDLCDAAGAKATFFTLGCVAQARPALVRRIVDAGHELASHSVDHRRVSDLDRAAFLRNLKASKAMLEDIGGVSVRGYRAPSFSINRQTPWAYECLAEAGYAYSSSSHPIRHDHYGDPNAPRGPHRMGTVIEIPVTTLLMFGRRWPVGGGGFFRLLPGGLFRVAARRASQEGLIPNFYLHPWEIDPGQPRFKAPLKTRLRHYIGLKGCEAKLARHMKALRWERMDQAYGVWLEENGQECAA